LLKVCCGNKDKQNSKSFSPKGFLTPLQNLFIFVLVRTVGANAGKAVPEQVWERRVKEGG